MKLSYLIIPFLFLSCSMVKVFNMKDVDQNLTKNWAHLQSLSIKIDKSSSYKKGMLYQIREHLNTVREMGLVSKVKEISEIEKKLKILISQNLKMINDFPYRSRSTIKSDQKEYKEVQTKISNLEIHNEKINQLISLHQKQEISLKKLLEEKSIYRIDPRKLQEQITAYRQTTSNQLLAASKKIDRAKEAFKNDLRKQNVFSRMKLSLHKIAHKKEELLAYLEELNSKIVGQKNYWVAPGMLGHGYIKEVKLKVKDLNSLVQEFENIQAELKTDLKQN